MKTLNKRFAPPALAATFVLLALASLAYGAEQTRESYVAAVEPICKLNSEASARIFNGVKAEVKAGKLKPAAAQFTKAASALNKTLTQLEAVPQPSADQAKLTKWLGYVKSEVELFERTAAKLKAGDKTGAESLTVRLTHNANLTNDQVLAFDFHYCKFEPSRYS